MDDAILRRLFLRRLPTACRTILAGRSDIADLSDLADIIDVVHDVTSFTAVSVSGPAFATPASPVDTVTLADMQQEIAALRRDLRTRASAPPTTGCQPASATSDAGLCWYHATFGQRARKCRVGCPFWRSGNARPAQ